MPCTRPWSIRFSRPVPYGVRLPQNVVATHRRAARVRLRECHEDTNGRRLAGPVRAEQREDFAVPHAEGHAVECLHLAVTLAEIVDGDRVHAPRGYSAARPWTCTSTRERSCSGASASRCPTGGSRRPPRRRVG